MSLLNLHDAYPYPASPQASTNRGSLVISRSGGASAMVTDEGVSRAPVIEFALLDDVRKFLLWLGQNETEIKAQAATTTSHGKVSLSPRFPLVFALTISVYFVQLIAIKPLVDGSRVMLKCEYYTGDASGQN